MLGKVDRKTGAARPGGMHRGLVLVTAGLAVAAAACSGTGEQKVGESPTVPKAPTATTTTLGKGTLQLCATHPVDGQWGQRAPSNLNFARVGKELGVAPAEVRDTAVMGSLDCPEGVAVDSIAAGTAIVRTIVDADTPYPVEADCVVIGVASDPSEAPAAGTTETAVLAVCVPPADIRHLFETSANTAMY
jgi:hypothetical protein